MDGRYLGLLASLFRTNQLAMWQIVLINALCLLIALGALVVALWTLATGQIQRQGIDALFLILVCLVFAVAFSLAPVRAIREGLLAEIISRYHARTSPPVQEPERRADADKAAS